MSMPRETLAGIRLLIFDLDGTLVDSKTDLALSVNAVREMMGLGALAHDLIASYVGHGVNTLIRRALGDQATNENVEKATALFLRYYRDHMLDNTVMYPGVAETLETLGGRTLAVLTNKPVNFSREMLTRLGVAGRFAFIYGGNSFEQKKPDPVGVNKLIGDTGVRPRQTMIVGDSDTDVLTGRNAGVWTCAVTYGYGAEGLRACPPDILIDDFRELPSLLNGTKDAGSRTTLRHTRSIED
ncbi:MAG TPA: HAD-IA family hydrolase [Terriglobia bacterium]|nr:HAD-IA family hydrolase [Terriglobia bacterium]